LNPFLVNVQDLIQVVQAADLSKGSVGINDPRRPVQGIEFVLGAVTPLVNSRNAIDSIILLPNFVSHRINRANLTAHQVVNVRKLVSPCINLNHAGVWGLIFINILFER